MLSREIKNKILKENNLDKVLEILKLCKKEDWDKEIIEHIQNITPDDEIGIETFSYLRPNKNDN